MDSYVFTYRRVRGNCSHCNKKKSFFSFLKTAKKKAIDKKECEFEWKSHTVIGHGPENYSRKETVTINGERSEQFQEGQNLDKMVLYFPNGALKTVADWANCELKLDVDWVLFTKKRMEKESGQDIKLSVNTDHKVDM